MGSRPWRENGGECQQQRARVRGVTTVVRRGENLIGARIENKRPESVVENGRGGVRCGREWVGGVEREERHEFACNGLRSRG